MNEVMKRLKYDLEKALNEETTVLFNVFYDDMVGLRGVSKISNVLFYEGRFEIFADNLVMSVSECKNVEYNEEDNSYCIQNDKCFTYIIF